MNPRVAPVRTQRRGQLRVGGEGGPAIQLDVFREAPHAHRPLPVNQDVALVEMVEGDAVGVGIGEVPRLCQAHVGECQGGDGLIPQPVEPPRLQLQLAADGGRIFQGLQGFKTLTRPAAVADAVGLADEGLRFPEPRLALRVLRLSQGGLQSHR